MSGRSMTEVREVAAPRDDEQPPAPPPPQIAQQPPGQVVNGVAAVDHSYIDLVESGRYDPREDDNDEPPSPSSRPETGQSRPGVTGEASPADSSPKTPPTAGEVLLSKDQLVSTINKLASFAECMTWPDNHEHDMEGLSDPDRREVEKVFNNKQAALKRTEDKK